MIQTDGKQTIANRPPRKATASERIRQAREMREAALDKAFGKPGEVTKIELDGEFSESELDALYGEREPAPRRHSGAANGIQWHEDRCACGGEIADSPAGDKCWDCFNFSPDE